MHWGDRIDRCDDGLGAVWREAGSCSGWPRLRLEWEKRQKQRDRLLRWWKLKEQQFFKRRWRVPFGTFYVHLRWWQAVSEERSSICCQCGDGIPIPSPFFSHWQTINLIYIILLHNCHIKCNVEMSCICRKLVAFSEGQCGHFCYNTIYMWSPKWMCCENCKNHKV